MRIIYAASFIFTLVVGSYAQIPNRSCGTTQAEKALKKRYPSRKSVSDSFFNVKTFKNFRIEADTMVIPVIVHVIHNGDAVGQNENISKEQIYSQIEVLNEDFQRKAGTAGFNNNTVSSGIAIKFVPAAVDPSGNILTDPGIHRVNGGRSTWNDMDQIDTILKPQTVFDPNKYMNIWVLTFGGTLSGTLGYAQLPDASSLSGIDTQNSPSSSDGVVIRFNVFGRTGNVIPRYNQGRTATHEVGHFLGLLHIWGDEEENVSCINDDGCDDTPKTTGPIYFCPSSPASCTPSISAMKENYMDYTDDACMNIFTNDQKERILTVLSNSPRRKELAASNTHIIPPPVAKFGIQNSVGCPSTVVNLFDSSLYYVEAWDWKIYQPSSSVPPLTSTSKNVQATLFTPGIYDVQLIVRNRPGKFDTLVKTSAINILSSPTLKLSVMPSSSPTTTCTFLNFTVSGGDTYTWRAAQGLLAANTSTFSWQADEALSLTVTGINSSNCSSRVVYNANAGTPNCTPNSLDEASQTANFYIFPNPADGLLNVHCPKSKGKTSKIYIYDISGVQQTALTMTKEEDSRFKIDISGLKSGLYLLKLLSDDGIWVQKFFKE